MKDRFLLVSKCLLNVMFFLGIPVTVSVPFFLKWYGSINVYYEKYYWPQTIMFLISGVFACLIVSELRGMIKTVEDDDCFVLSNVLALKKMGDYAFIIAVVTFFRMFLYFTPGVLVVILVFVIAGLFSKVLSKVFARAVAYKQENDMTI